MITMTFRMRKERILAFALVGGLLLGGGIFVRNTMLGQALSAEAGSKKPKKISLTAKTEADRRSFIAAYGWEVAEEPEEIRDVLIPKEFDETFEKYNFLQKQQNFNLAKQKGKTCRRYTYTVSNYPGGVENVRLNMLVYKNKVVGGDVSTASLDGFMHGFDMASSATWLGLPHEEEQAKSTMTQPETPAKGNPSKGSYPKD